MSPPHAARPVVAGSTLALPPLGPAEVDQERSWARDLSRLRRAGFEAVDLVDTWLSPASLTTRDRSRLRILFDDLGLQLVGISTIRRSVIDPQHGDENVGHTLATIDAAHELGAPIVCIGFHRPLTPEQSAQWPFWTVDAPGDPSDEATWELAVSRLSQLCEYAAAAGIELSLELYEGTLLGSGQSAAHLVADVGASNLGINPDLANLHRQPRELDETWDSTLEHCLPYMNFWHVKNFVRAPVWPAGPFPSFPVVLADGDIDYFAAFSMALASGYRGPICIEHYGGDRLWAQRCGREYVEWLLEELPW